MSAAQAFALAPWRAAVLSEVEEALGRWVGARSPESLAQPMRYAVLDGGKRIRPLLVYAAGAAVGGQPEAVLRAACAVELIHAYSLVHDDMPCMDNDVLRRGKPTVHVQFGQASALLAGDALQALAFEVLTPEHGVDAATQARLCALLARAAGSTGMAGGQAIDLASVGLRLQEAQLSEMHRLKTGALLHASVMMGAACGQATAAALAQLDRFAQALGLAFQVMDDVLDVSADAATLGKTAGKDAAQDKPTYVALLGLPAARAYAEALHQQALLALQDLDACWPQADAPPAQALRALAHLLVQRVY